MRHLRKRLMEFTASDDWSLRGSQAAFLTVGLGNVQGSSSMPGICGDINQLGSEKTVQ